jgi:hypothetical protein
MPSEAAGPSRALVYVYCFASGPGKVVRSDLIPLDRRPLPEVERAWNSYTLSEYPGVTARRCQAARSPGKAAAYMERDARVRTLQQAVGATAILNTGWTD